MLRHEMRGMIEEDAETVSEDAETAPEASEASVASEALEAKPSETKQDTKFDFDDFFNEDYSIFHEKSVPFASH